MRFDPEESRLLKEIARGLRRVAEWPLESPLAFVVGLASGTKGRLGKLILTAIAKSVGTDVKPSRSALFDLLLLRRRGPTRTEVKFSTEQPPRFQQIRNPRTRDGLKYDALVCISGRPDGLVYWVIDAADVETHIAAGRIARQHQDSESYWFFPSRDGQDAFREHRTNLARLKKWLSS